MSSPDRQEEILRLLGKYLDRDRLLKENPSITKRELDQVLAERGIQSLRPQRKTVSSVVLHTDGASSGNPGPSGIGVVITDTSGDVLGEISKFIGRTTNNVAEYAALVAGLEAAARLGADYVTIHADSELLVRQLNGEYKVKSPNIRPHWREALRRLDALRGWKAMHVPRDTNDRADALARQAIAEAEAPQS